MNIAGVVSIRDNRMDWLLLFAVLVTTVLGLVMVLSASGVMAEKYWDSRYHFFLRQGAFAVVGVLAMAATALTPRGVIYRLTYVWLALVVLLLLLTLVSPLGVTVNGASRWLRLAGFSLQPLELTKIALILYLAYFYSSKQDRIRTFSIGFLPPFIMTGLLCAILVLQPDFGGAVFLAMLLFFMSIVGGTRISYLTASVFFSLAAAAYLIMHSPYRFRRWFAFVDPFEDAQDVGYQLVQSFYAFGSGRLFGVGLGSGRQKLFFLPEAHNDFLMAVVGEELGFLGISIFFVLIGVILWRAFGVALAQEDLRDRLTAYGCSLILALGFFLNLAVVLGMVPPKGVPMPFVSYGGSSLLVSFICAGMLLNMSRDCGENA
jgi:cell division protein FtsW